LKVIDFIILFVLILGAFRGFQKGFVLEVIGIIGFMLGIIAGLYFTPYLSDLFSGLFEQHQGLVRIICFIIIFIVVVVAFNLVGVALKKTIDLTPLGMFDDVAGALVGILLWAITLSFLLWFTELFGIKLSTEYTDGSLLYPFLADLAPVIVETVSTVMPSVKDFFDSLRPEKVPEERQVLNLATSLALKTFC
jgi:membrane protein required for colicin V production